MINSSMDGQDEQDEGFEISNLKSEKLFEESR
jgi:hypothetical protein